MSTETQADRAAELTDKLIELIDILIHPLWIVPATETPELRGLENIVESSTSPWLDHTAHLDAHVKLVEQVRSTAQTWTSPTGQEFTGTPDYIVGVKTGWDARASSLFAQMTKHPGEHHHPNDTTTQPKGEVW